MPRAHDVSTLVSFLTRIPGVVGSIGSGTFENGNWWTNFTLDLDHPQAWNVVQELGYVLNYLSLDSAFQRSSYLCHRRRTRTGRRASSCHGSSSAVIQSSRQQLALGGSRAVYRLPSMIFHNGPAMRTNRPNQTMQLTASKHAIYAGGLCRRARVLRGMHSGLAAADLVTR